MVFWFALFSIITRYQRAEIKIVVDGPEIQIIVIIRAIVMDKIFTVINPCPIRCTLTIKRIIPDEGCPIGSRFTAVEIITNGNASFFFKRTDKFISNIRIDRRIMMINPDNLAEQITFSKLFNLFLFKGEINYVEQPIFWISSKNIFITTDLTIDEIVKATIVICEITNSRQLLIGCAIEPTMIHRHVSSRAISI